MKIYNATTAAKKLRVDPETVRRMIHSGRITVVKLWGQWVITEEGLKGVNNG